MARFVLDLEQHLGRRVQRGQHLGQCRRQRGMEDHGPGLGVVEQVLQLLAHVAVVDVERGHAGPVGAQHPFEILVAVVQRQGDVVLPRLPARQVGPLAVHAQAAAVQVGGETAGALLQVGVGQAAVPPHNAFPVAQGLDQGVEGLGQVELDGV